MVPETYSDPLIAEQAEVEVNDDESEVDIQADHEGSFKKYGSPTQFKLNGGKEMTLRSQERILVDVEDIGDHNLLVELLRFQRRFGHCSFIKLQVMAERGIIPKRLKIVRSQSAIHIYMKG